VVGSLFRVIAGPTGRGISLYFAPPPPSRSPPWASLSALDLVVLYAIDVQPPIRLRQLADNAWADIDVQPSATRPHPLRRRRGEGHAGYERGTLESVVEARSRASRCRPRRPGPGRSRVWRVAPKHLRHREAYPRPPRDGELPRAAAPLSDVRITSRTRAVLQTPWCGTSTRRSRQFPSSLVAGLLRFAAAGVLPVSTTAPSAPSQRCGWGRGIGAGAARPRVAHHGAGGGPAELVIERFRVDHPDRAERDLEIAESISPRSPAAGTASSARSRSSTGRRRGSNWTLGLTLRERHPARTPVVRVETSAPDITSVQDLGAGAAGRTGPSCCATRANGLRFSRITRALPGT